MTDALDQWREAARPHLTEQQHVKLLLVGARLVLDPHATHPNLRFTIEDAGRPGHIHPVILERTDRNFCTTAQEAYDTFWRLYKLPRR